MLELLSTFLVFWMVCNMVQDSGSYSLSNVKFVCVLNKGRQVGMLFLIDGVVSVYACVVIRIL